MTLPIALQLYTVRESMNKDVEGTLQQVAAAGYRNVELAGYYKRTAEDFKKLLDRFKLTAIGAHVSPDATEENMKKLADEARLFGYRYVVTSGFPGFQWGKDPTVEEWTAGVKKLAQISELARKHGLTFCYHNHSFEFVKLAGGSQRPMDMIYDHPARIAAELDVYWVTHGHDDPLAWMDRLTGRVPLLHVKDMAPGSERKFSEVGTGVVKIKEVVARAAKVGAQFLIVEQDSNWIDSDPVKSAVMSLHNLQRIAGR